MKNCKQREEIYQWILQKTKLKAEARFGWGDDLIATRIVDSLIFVELLLVAERVYGRAVPVDAIQPSQLCSINALHQTFLEGKDGQNA